MQDVLLNGNGLTFYWNDKASAFFQENKVYLQYPWRITNVFKENDKVFIPSHIIVEPYANMPPRQFLSMGAFSYCRSTSLPADFRIGRYGSIAPLVRLSDQEHPLDRLSTHVFTFREHTARLARTEFGKTIRQQPVRLLKEAPEIGHDVWLGRGCIIKR